MKKITLLLFCFTTIGFSQNTFVPDDNFEQFLIDQGYDSGPLDDFVPTANINTVFTLSIGFKGISDLTGIEDFTELRQLYCAGNNLTTLDISNNLLLSILNCLNNDLTELDVSLNTNLTHFNCNGNNLSSLNVKNGNNTNFINFNASGNSNLTCITVDDESYSSDNWMNIDSQTVFSVNCSSLTTANFHLDEAFMVYPNPVINQITVSSKIDGDYSIITVNKQILKQGKLKRGNTKIDIVNFKEGLYLLKIETINGSIIKKIIKE